MKPTRRRAWERLSPLAAVLAVLLLALAAHGQAAEGPAAAPTREAGEAFSFEALVTRARELAGHDFVAPKQDDLPEWLAKLDYDGYRHVRFQPEAAHWADAGLPFRLQFMHRGYLFGHRVRVHEVEGGVARELRFSPEQFAYDAGRGGDLPDDLGYSGLSIAWRGREPGKWDEVAEFQGASYYRLLGTDEVYGSSARGLAIDTATGHGEEFPEFTELWVEKPAPDAASLTVDALLNSPGLTGAFRFVISPGAQTAADVTVCLFPRHAIGQLGVAPLTSMFLFGEDGRHRLPDYRPEVHDADGLLVAARDGSCTWRPLANPERTHRTLRLPLADPAGFGLLQRDRAFASYADLESHFERRPGLWVAPRGDWGKGALELVEIPSSAEWNENVVAFWVPETPVERGQSLRVEYTLISGLEEPPHPALARVRDVRVRPGDAPLFVVDFDGLPPAADGAEVVGEAQTSHGAIRDLVLQPGEVAGQLRCSFGLADPGKEPLQLHVTLRRGEQPVSETLLLDWVQP